MTRIDIEPVSTRLKLEHSHDVSHERSTRKANVCGLVDASITMFDPNTDEPASLPPNIPSCRAPSRGISRSDQAPSEDPQRRCAQTSHRTMSWHPWRISSSWRPPCRHQTCELRTRSWDSYNVCRYQTSAPPGSDVLRLVSSKAPKEMDNDWLSKTRVRSDRSVVRAVCAEMVKRFSPTI